MHQVLNSPLPELSADLEWSGQINQVVGHGRSFALLLAMLSEDVLSRPDIIDPSDETPAASVNLQSYYRNAPLDATNFESSLAFLQATTLHQHPLDFVLLSTIHPQPLHFRNDVYAIDDDVIANCPIHVQRHLKGQDSRNIGVDETKLYDIIKQLND